MNVSPPGGSPQVRRAEPEDAAAISALILGLEPFLGLDRAAEGAATFLASISLDGIGADLGNPAFVHHVAEVEGRLAGVVAIREGRHLFHLFVAEAFHRRGVAKKLWEAAALVAREGGNGEGRFTVNASLYAEPVYRNLGFRPTGERQVKNGLVFVPMALELGVEPANAPTSACVPQV